MDRRLLPAWMLTVAALALAPQAASAARLPADYVPSPGDQVVFSLQHSTLTGGAGPATAVLVGSEGGGIGPSTNTPSASGSEKQHPATSKPRKRKKPKRKPVKRPKPRTVPGPGWYDVPPAFRRLYRAAGRRYGVDWRVLAAIGKLESDHGRSTLPGVHSGLNFASCCSGVMQMCTVESCGQVWQYYAIDADDDGSASVFDPPDAIYAAGALVRDLQATFGRAHARLILAAYNAGPGAVQKYDGVPPYPETEAYVAAGAAYMKSLRPRRVEARRTRPRRR